MKFRLCFAYFHLALCLGFLHSSIPASAQTPVEGVPTVGNSFTGLTGLTAISEKNEAGESETFAFYRLNLRPEFSFGKVGIGFDAVMLYNPDKGFRTEDGEKVKGKNIVRWIRTLRYARRGEPVYFLYGALENVHIGYGFLMGSYYNYDRRGLRLDLNSEDVGGIETMLNNITEPEIFGGRVHFTPIKKSVSTSLLKDITFGASYFTDVNPDPNNDGESPLVAYSADVGFPIIQKRLLSVSLYDELAFIRDYKEDHPTGKGNAVGIGINLIDDIDFKIQYRIFDEKFQPTLFDYLYEDLKRRGELEIGGESAKGIYSIATYNLLRKVFFIGTYENYDNSPAKVQVEAIETDLIEKISVRGLYIKRNIEDFKDIFDIDDKSALRVEFGYEFAPPLQIVVNYDFTFRQKEEGEGFEQIRKVSAQLGVASKF